MLGSLSVMTGVSVWVRKQWRERQERRAVRRRRNWHGYIEGGMLSSWYVRLAEEPETPSGRVVLEVLDGADGEPSTNLARALRTQVETDGMLARVPTPEEYEFLRVLRQERGYGKDPKAFPIR